MAAQGRDVKDEVIDELRRTNEAVVGLVEEIRQRGGITQTIIHKSEGMGAWGAGAVAACFCTYLALIIFAVWTIFQVNNLTAWENVYGRDLAAMKQQIIGQERKP